jgi:mono/diheme cytochrome c family protein
VNAPNYPLILYAMHRLLLAGLFLLGATSLVAPHDLVTTSITWNREISRVFFDRCAICHNEKGTAFSLMTYAEARPWAVAIKEEVLSRRMPPWGAVKGFGEFRSDQGLTQEQLEIITAWVEGGVPEGNPKDLPPKPKLAKPSTTGARRNQIVVSGELTLNKPFKLDGLIPQEVPAGVPLKIVAKLPDGSIEPLLWLYEYKAQYKHAFLLRKPLNLPVGTIIRGVPSGASVILLPA